MIEKLINQIKEDLEKINKNPLYMSVWQEQVVKVLYSILISTSELNKKIESYIKTMNDKIFFLSSSLDDVQKELKELKKEVKNDKS